MIINQKFHCVKQPHLVLSSNLQYVNCTGRHTHFLKIHCNAASIMCCPRAKDFKDHDDTMTPLLFSCKTLYPEPRKKQPLFTIAQLKEITQTFSVCLKMLPTRKLSGDI